MALVLLNKPTRRGRRNADGYPKSDGWSKNGKGDFATLRDAHSSSNSTPGQHLPSKNRADGGKLLIKRFYLQNVHSVSNRVRGKNIKPHCETIDILLVSIFGSSVDDCIMLLGISHIENIFLKGEKDTACVATHTNDKSGTRSAL